MSPETVSRRSVDILREDHAFAGRVAAALEALGSRLRSGTAVPFLPVAGAVDVLARFLGRCHETKEDEALFPALAARGWSLAAAPLAGLQAEHEHGRRLLAVLGAELARRQRVDPDIGALLDSYVRHQQAHMAREDESVFPEAERCLSPDDEARILAGFARIDAREICPGERAVCAALVAGLEEAARPSAATDPRFPGIVAAHVMRRRPGAARPGDSLARAAELMEGAAARELPVVDGKALVGILSHRDLEPHRGHFEWTPVRAAMTPEPVAVGPETPIGAVARLLEARRFNSVPVTAAGSLVGMLGRGDLVRVLGSGSH